MRQNNKNTINKHPGFTLIELLVVIAIIGMLSSIVLMSLTKYRAIARDANRIANMRAVKTALDLYYNANGFYPDTGLTWTDSCADPANYIPGLAPLYVSSLPRDILPCGTPAKFNLEHIQYGYISDGQHYELAIHPETNAPQFKDFFDPISDGGPDCRVFDGPVATHFVFFNFDFPC